jgi:hypothetical protein
MVNLAQFCKYVIQLLNKIWDVTVVVDTAEHIGHASVLFCKWRNSDL